MKDPELIKEDAEELSEWVTNEIFKTSASESESTKKQIWATAKAAGSEIYPVVEHIVNDTVDHIEVESQGKQDSLKVEQDVRFKVTKAMAEEKLQGFEVLINKTTSEAARMSRSRALADQVRNTTERSTGAISQLHEAEDMMVHTAKSAVESGKLASKQWKKTILQKNAGKDFAVGAAYESKEASYEAEVAVEQVSTSMTSAQTVTQLVDKAFNTAHKADVKSTKLRNYTVALFKQVNATTKGIVWQQQEVQLVMDAANHAVEQAINATNFALHAQVIIPKKKPAEMAEAAAPASADSEDAE